MLAKYLVLSLGGVSKQHMLAMGMMGNGEVTPD